MSASAPTASAIANILASLAETIVNAKTLSSNHPTSVEVPNECDQIRCPVRFRSRHIAVHPIPARGNDAGARRTVSAFCARQFLEGDLYEHRQTLDASACRYRQC